MATSLPGKKKGFLKSGAGFSHNFNIYPNVKEKFGKKNSCWRNDNY